jgi:hypothetical protein
VFDLDGVLSDAADRQHFLAGPRRDWNSFFESCGEDPLIEEVARLLSLLDEQLAIILLTARPARVRPQTVEWLDRFRLRWDLLVMRGVATPARPGTSNGVPSASSRRGDSTFFSPSRTIGETSRCSARRESPRYTSIRVTTTDLLADSQVNAPSWW